MTDTRKSSPSDGFADRYRMQCGTSDRWCISTAAVATHLDICSWVRDGPDEPESGNSKSLGQHVLDQVSGDHRGRDRPRSGGSTASSVARTEQLAHEYFRDQAYWLSKKDIFSSPEKIEPAYATKGPVSVRPTTQRCRMTYASSGVIVATSFDPRSVATGIDSPLYAGQRTDVCRLSRRSCSALSSLPDRATVCQSTGDRRVVVEAERDQRMRRGRHRTS